MESSDRFDRFYREMYPVRWDQLKSALLESSETMGFAEDLLQPYFLDEASVIAASLLPVQPGDAVLDMCAAPGGKSLVLATRLHGSGSLVCNDRSSQRRARLKRVIDDHLPASFRSIVSITSHDATKWGLHERDAYDAILLDAPCSSERHVLQDPKALAIWGPARTKHLAIQQFAMLAAALDAVRVGGHILYSTCSISTLENEGVIAKLQKKRVGRYEEIHLEAPFSEKRDHGAIILPDSGGGRGPLYFCLIRRTA